MVVNDGKKYSLGIVIRTYNESKYLPKCIKILKNQKLDRISDFEILVIDSTSTDDTIQIAKSEGCTLIVIPKNEFNYGGTLNRGIAALDKELIIAISAHTIPADGEFFNSMIAPFNNPTVAGTYIRQIPWPDAPFPEKVRIKKTFGNNSEVFTRTQEKNMHFSNVASCFRKSLWEIHPFHTLPSSEDYFWAEAMLGKGKSIVYITNSAVFHSHSDSCSTLANRLYTIQRNKMALVNASARKETLMTYYAAFSHIKQVFSMCLLQRGGIREKTIALFHSCIEALLIVDHHLKYTHTTNTGK